jgi:hypothetical protein
MSAFADLRPILFEACHAVTERLGIDSDSRFVVEIAGPADDGLCFLSLCYEETERRTVEVDLPPDSQHWQMCVYQLANQWQDEVIDDLREARPVCEGHSHPLEVDIDAGLAVWICPLDATRRYPVWVPSANPGP